MTPYYEDESVRLFAGDCLDVLRGLPDNSVDAVVTDPPYGLAFMGRAWDDHVDGRKFGAWCEQWATECWRVLKPGGHLLAFGGTRTYHRLGCAIEDAGFEMRDSITWLYGSGFPKSLDVSKAIDKAAGAERAVIGTAKSPFRMADPKMGDAYMSTQTGDSRKVDPDGYIIRETTAPATDAARQWSGWGTALKPASEPIVVARKPLSSTVAANVLRYGTGALNVDGCRVPATDTFGGGAGTKPSETSIFGVGGYEKGSGFVAGPAAGRWPTNVVLSHAPECNDGTCPPGCAVRELDTQSGDMRARGNVNPERSGGMGYHGGAAGYEGRPPSKGDRGGASRFFKVVAADEGNPYPEPGSKCGNCPHSNTPCHAWCMWEDGDWFADREDALPNFRYEAKAPTVERPRDGSVAHPTVKPLDLMRWLVRLVTPPGGTVLEPFAGSGTTAEAAVIEGFQCIAIEREPSYLPLIVARLSKPIQPDLFGGAA